MEMTAVRFTMRRIDFAPFHDWMDEHYPGWAYHVDVGPLDKSKERSYRAVLVQCGVIAAHPRYIDRDPPLGAGMSILIPADMQPKPITERWALPGYAYAYKWIPDMGWRTVPVSMQLPLTDS